MRLRSSTLIPVAGLLLAGAARLANFRGTFSGGQVFPGGEDSYLHARRILQAVADFPFVPAFDAYVHFPAGARADWPPGFDLLCALPAWVLGLGRPGEHLTLAVAALMVPLLGVLGCWVTGRVGGRLGGRTTGHVALALCAVLPAHVGYSMVGRIDHHVAEPLALGAAVLLQHAAFRTADPLRARALGLATGLALGAGLACWPGTILFVIAAAVAACAAAVLERDDPAAPGRLAAAGLVPLATVLALATAFAALSPWGRAGESVYFALSWLQPGIALGCLVATLLVRLWLVRRSRLVPLLLLGGVAAASVPLLRQGLAYMTRQGTQQTLVVESLPLWLTGDGITPQGLCTWPGLLAPVGLLLAGRRVLRERDAGLLLALAPLALVLAVAPLQRRFGSFASVAAASLAALALTELAARIPRRSSRWLLGAAVALALTPQLLTPRRLALGAAAPRARRRRSRLRRVPAGLRDPAHRDADRPARLGPRLRGAPRVGARHHHAPGRGRCGIGCGP